MVVLVSQFATLQFQPVKDGDPHFHHFLLSQTEKVSFRSIGLGVVSPIQWVCLDKGTVRCVVLCTSDLPAQDRAFMDPFTGQTRGCWKKPQHQLWVAFLQLL